MRREDIVAFAGRDRNDSRDWNALAGAKADYWACGRRAAGLRTSVMVVFRARAQEAGLMRARLRYLLPVVALATAVAVCGGQPAYEKSLEIRASGIPHAGNGVYTKTPIPKGAVLGAYEGEFVTEEEYRRRLDAGRWQYMMGLLDCAKPHTGGLATIDGVKGNAFTRMNYAPAEFQNVKFEKICAAPFVRIVALRDIAADEELWVDYGPKYRYDFMEDPAVIAFFADLRARGAKKDRSGG